MFTLVSNMKILSFNLIIYNFHNRSASSALISLDEIIFSRGLTCSSYVCFSYCRSPTCCSFLALYWFTLGTYDGTEIGSPEGSTEGTTGGNIEGLFLGYWLGSIDAIYIGIDVDN